MNLCSNCEEECKMCKKKVQWSTRLNSGCISKSSRRRKSKMFGYVYRCQSDISHSDWIASAR